MREPEFARYQSLGCFGSIGNLDKVLLQRPSRVGHHGQGRDNSMDIVVLKDFGECRHVLVICGDEASTNFFLFSGVRL
jgi:hypothetical protein